MPAGPRPIAARSSTTIDARCDQSADRDKRKGDTPNRLGTPAEPLPAKSLFSGTAPADRLGRDPLFPRVARPSPDNPLVLVSAMNATYLACLGLMVVALMGSFMRGGTRVEAATVRS